MSPKPTWKPRARFTLRALLASITLFMLWGGYHTNRSREERAAETFLRERGASLQYGPKLAGKSVWNRLVWTYSKVVQVVWRERFITDVVVFGRLTPDEVDALVALPHLEGLTACPVKSTREDNILIHRTKVVEVKADIPKGALPRILTGHKLKGLWLSQWALSDDDCKAIASHEHLEGLSLLGSKFSEEGLAAIVQLPRLRRLNFSYCPISGAMLATTPGSASLEWVECRFVPVGNEFAGFIGRSQNVTYLCCYYKEIDDNFIAAIGPHRSLEGLILGHTKATDASALVLQQMPSLKGVTVASPDFSEAAKALLKKNSPSLAVE